MDSPTPDSHDAEAIEPLGAIAPSVPIVGSPVWISYLLLAVFTFLILVEFVAAYGLHRVSKIQHRIREEYLAALLMRQTHTKGRTQVLLAGNSLLIADVDLSLLKEQLPANFEVKRFAVEQTTYLDWHYGLRRLFVEGSRPDVLVLALTARHLAASEVLGEYFAHNLMRAGDLARVAHDLQLDRTTESNLLFGHVSAFYASRSDIRKWLLGKVFPGMPALMEILTQVPPQPPSEASLRSIASRLAELKRLTGEYDVRLILLAPPVPAFKEDSYLDVLTAAASAAEVPMLVALRPDELRREDYGPDGLHMNDTGAERHTRALAPLLTAAVDSQYESAAVAAR